MCAFYISHSELNWRAAGLYVNKSGRFVNAIWRTLYSFHSFNMVFLKKYKKKFVHTYYFIHMYTTIDVSICMNAIAREEESYRDFGGPSTNANLYMHHSRPLLGLLTRKAHCKPDLFGEQRRRGESVRV